MKVLFITAEMFPFSKIGGLGDVAGLLSAALANRGLDVRVITPAYGIIDREKFGLKKTDLGFKEVIGEKEQTCTILSWESPENNNLKVYFLENEQYYSGRNVYTDYDGQVYADNPERFLLLSKAALALPTHLRWKPDILHCHDNHAALVPVYLKYVSAYESYYANSRTLLTLHNVAYQGTLSMANRPLFELPDDLFKPMGALEWWGKINPLKSGIIFADGINTVSPTHARELMKDSTINAGMGDILGIRKSPVEGILNGADYDEWDPGKDSLIYQTYSAEDLKGKRINKRRIIKEFNFKAELQTKPLICMISRLVEHKGIDIVLQSMERLLALGVGMIVLGCGDDVYRTALEDFAKRFPRKFYFLSGFKPKAAHQILAASDMFLMPSRFEPCGIAQMNALKYGTLPVVHKTGGLADTVFPWTAKKGNGFLFEDYSAETLVKTVKKAISVFKNKERWQRLMLNGMKAEYSWSKSAESYSELYSRLLKS
jgi:starch synthase